MAAKKDPRLRTRPSELILATRDGKFSVKHSLSTNPMFALKVSAKLVGRDGKTVTGGEKTLASWTLQQGTLLLIS
ncbi:MAG: hypothetical protein ACLQAT_10035 [Candidatus Binataceae bacterium]